MLEANNFKALKIGIADLGLMVRLLNLRLLTIEHLSLKEMDYFAKRSLDLREIMNVLVVSIRDLDTRI